MPPFTACARPDRRSSVGGDTNAEEFRILSHHATQRRSSERAPLGGCRNGRTGTNSRPRAGAEDADDEYERSWQESRLSPEFTGNRTNGSVCLLESSVRPTERPDDGN
jgi:hypothetical protein